MHYLEPHVTNRFKTSNTHMHTKALHHTTALDFDVTTLAFTMASNLLITDRHVSSTVFSLLAHVGPCRLQGLLEQGGAAVQGRAHICLQNGPDHEVHRVWAVGGACPCLRTPLHCSCTTVGPTSTCAMVHRPEQRRIRSGMISWARAERSPAAGSDLPSCSPSHPPE